MSVINQMLKDLEQRSPETNTHSAQVGHVTLAYSSRKIVVVTGLCVLAVCLISFYVWQLISENNALKAEQVSNHTVHSVDAAQGNSTKNITTVQNSTANIAEPLPSHENEIYQTPTPVVAYQQTKEIQNNQQVSEKVKAKATEVSDFSQASSTNTAVMGNSAVNNSERITPTLVVNNNLSRVTPAKHTAVIADTLSHSATASEARSEHDHDVAPAEAKAKTSNISVSRRQLSADELAAQKLTLAEKALAAKQVDKAEKLLEDVVIIKPSDSQTRKKLAALWFGRQAYQDAVNLLSQGIALNGTDSSLRQMKARIHLKQGQLTAALNSLTPLAQLKDEQYQIMLANTAQQAQQNTVAVDAYKMLIAMQPEIGRWQLGLAILYDKNSQFNLASVAYKNALTKNDLSISSENFVIKRIQAIGQ